MQGTRYNGHGAIHPRLNKDPHMKPYSPTPPARNLSRGAISFVLYLVVIESFLAVPLFNGATQIRPASGLGPALGLLFGAPGIVGSVAANFLSDLVHYPDAPLVMLAYLAVQVSYIAAPRIAWRVLFPQDKLPHLGSAKRIAAYLAIALADAALSAVLLLPLESASMVALNIHVVRLLNNFLMLVYVGMPTVLIGERKLMPNAMRGLARRAAVASLGVAGATSVICAAAVLLPQSARLMSELQFANLAASVYIALSTITACLFVVACLILNMIDGKLITPIARLSDDARAFTSSFEQAGAKQTSEGALDITLKDGTPLPEVAELVRETNAMRRALGSSVLEAQNAFRERERAAAELSVASSIQMAMLPRDIPALEQRHATAIDAVMAPAREVGGDFYDVFSLDEYRICAVVADVSGKGVPAALFMMRAMTDLRECIRSSSSLGEAFTTANKHLSTQNDSLLFVTAFAVMLNCQTGELSYVNAGHNAPWLDHTGAAGSWFKAPAGLPLGALGGFVYRDNQSVMLPGDTALLYTDGVNEARDASGALFGNERLALLLNRVFDERPRSGLGKGVESEVAVAEADCEQGPVGPASAVHAAVQRFSSGVEQADDITVLSLTWLPNTQVITVEPELPSNEKVCSFVKRAVPGASRRTMYAIELVCEEIFVNITTHAFERDGEKLPIRVRVAIDESRNLLHMAFCDEGIPYDPLTQQSRAVQASDDLQPGGLGILLVRRYAKFMTYQRMGATNALHLAIPLDGKTA